MCIDKSSHSLSLYIYMARLAASIGNKRPPAIIGRSIATDPIFRGVETIQQETTISDEDLKHFQQHSTTTVRLMIKYSYVRLMIRYH